MNGKASVYQMNYIWKSFSGTPYGTLEDLYNPDYDDYEEHNEVSEEHDDAILKPPGFISNKLDLVVNEGETIRLPCIVTRWVKVLFYIKSE